MPRLLSVGLVALFASALPTATPAQIVRSTPATSSPAQFDPFGNPMSNPYLNPLMAATAQPTNPSTTLLYMMGARRYAQGQQEAVLEQQKNQNRSEEALRKARGQATAVRPDAARSRYRFDTIRTQADQPPAPPAESRYRFGSTQARSGPGTRSDLPTGDRFGRTGSYYYR